MHDHIDMYAPCPCGSGKKYKFCCHQRKQAGKAATVLPLTNPVDKSWRELFPGIDIPGLDEAMALNQQGLRLIEQNRLDEALAPLRQAVGIAPVYFPSANNLALLLFHLGNLDEAIAVQRKSEKASPLPNAFGLANLATFLYVAGQEKEAERCLERLRCMKLLSADICAKVCETLARFKRHQEILELAAADDFNVNAETCYFTGLAAANTGDRQRAMQDLQRAVFSPHHGDRAKLYLGRLRDGSEPHSVLGDWPYFTPVEVLPINLFTKASPNDEVLDAYIGRRVLVDFCEACINESPAHACDSVEILGLARHPYARTIIKAITFGTFGADELRETALQEMLKRRELKHGQIIKVFRDGDWCEIQCSNTKLNPDYHFGAKLPRKIEKRYANTVDKAFGDDPRWDELGDAFLDIFKKVPKHYPALFNYAISLVRRGMTEEAEPLLLDIIRDHPDYLFAHALLMNLYCMQERFTEAEELELTTRMPAETHPDAMIAWYMALFTLHSILGNSETAIKHLELARDINPDHPAVEQAYDGLGLYDDELV